MATRSRIGVLYKDGTVKAVYCHWDGYPDEVGSKLLEFYNSVEKVESLMLKGDMSSLGESPESSVYYVDRGEQDVEAAIYSSLDEYKRIGEEYQYWLDQETNTWYYCHFSRTAKSLQEYFKKDINEEDNDQED